MTLTPSTELVDRAVRRLVAEGSGIEGSLVIPGNDPHPAPQSLYASVLLYNSMTNGMFQTQHDALGEPQEYLVYVAATFSVQWFRRGAVEAASRFRMWAETPEAAETMAARGFLYMRCGLLRRLDAVISSNYEERAGLDLELTYAQRQTAETGSIGSVEIEIVTAETSQEVSIDGA